MTDSFKIGNDLQRGERTVPQRLSYSIGVCNKTAASMGKINYILKSVQLVGYADNVNIMNRKKRDIPEASKAKEEIRKK
jgi:hypothetical protein